MTSVMWFRRDLRGHDNEALAAACADGPCVPVFVLDPVFLEKAGAPRLSFLFGALASLNETLGGSLVVRTGDPVEVLPALAREVSAESVYVAKDFAPYGRNRDMAVAAALKAAGSRLRGVGSPYAVEPGSVTKDDGTPYAVFTPFYKRWSPLLTPLEESDPVHSLLVAPGSVATESVPARPAVDADLPEPSERAAHERWEWFCDNALAGYYDDRNAPGVDGTSKLSTYLRFGLLHPKQLIADLVIDGTKATKGHEHFRSELCWREFYADVLFHQPNSAWENLQKKMGAMRLDTDKRAEARFGKWCAGETGYPIVDAGMRQLLRTGWMHNRVRMITASFLVKDLHLPWQWGARHFMRHLVDGDIASNNHGWQWTAGTGTDAAPYFRIFNPQSQSEKFDPAGDYIREFVPELVGCPTTQIHQPGAGGFAGYLAPMVDHSVEREESLSRYKAVSGK
jgi:deoxyribodipyrimidine photo-lyase